jgi:hypothetical protein
MDLLNIFVKILFFFLKQKIHEQLLCRRSYSPSLSQTFITINIKIAKKKRTNNKANLFLVRHKRNLSLLNMYKSSNLLLVFTVFILIQRLFFIFYSTDIYDGGRESQVSKRPQRTYLIPFSDGNLLFIFIAFQFKSD